MDRTAKKHLMAIPVQPYTGDGSAFARVYTEKDILMLHLWNNGEFKGRHLVDKAGKYVAEIGGAMCIKKLEYQLNSSQRYECGWLDVEVSEEDERMLRESAASGRGRTLDCMGRSYAPGKERSKCDAQSTGRQRNPRPDEHGDGLRRRHGEDKNDDTEGRVLLVWQDRPDRGAPLFWRTESQIV